MRIQEMIPQTLVSLSYTREFEILGWWWGFGMVVTKNCPKLFCVSKKHLFDISSSSSSNMMIVIVGLTTFNKSIETVT